MPTNLDSSSVSGAKSRSLLYVEDNPFLRFTVSKLLTKEGYGVQTASNGVDALVKIDEATAPFDIILTDQEMPQLDGLGLVRRLRETRFHGVIVVYSSALTPSATAEFQAMAVDAILTKGTRANVFLSQLSQATGSIPKLRD